MAAFNTTNTGNQELNIELNGTNLIGSIGTIGVGNLTFDDDDNLTDATPLSTAFQSLFQLSTQTIKTAWVEVTVPTGTYPESYAGNMTIRS